MKARGWGYLLLIPLVAVGLALLANLLPSLPLAGRILGEEPEAWIGDRAQGRVAGIGKENRPAGVDIDFIKVKGVWYKISGPLYVTKGGRLVGWHHPLTREELEELEKWPVSRPLVRDSPY